jgi:hypothetical protein
VTACSIILPTLPSSFKHWYSSQLWTKLAKQTTALATPYHSMWGWSGQGNHGTCCRQLLDLVFVFHTWTSSLSTSSVSQGILNWPTTFYGSVYRSLLSAPSASISSGRTLSVIEDFNSCKFHTKTQCLPYREQILSPLQRPVSYRYSQCWALRKVQNRYTHCE